MAASGLCPPPLPPQVQGWADEFAGAQTAASRGDWADEFADGLTAGGEWAQQFAGEVPTAASIEQVR